MKIADSLRHECMPEMVFSICKMSMIQTDKEKIQRAISLNNTDKATQDQFNKVYKFACDCGFIKDVNGVVECLLDKKILNSFAEFRMQIANEVFTNKNSKFVTIAEWYMGKEDEYIFSRDTGDTLAAYINAELGLGVDKFYALGFRFWMVDLGFLSFQNYRKAAAMFSCHNYLIQWIGEKNFEKNKYFLYI